MVNALVRKRKTNFINKILFNKKNNKKGPAFKNIELRELFATIGLHSLNEYV